MDKEKEGKVSHGRRMKKGRKGASRERDGRHEFHLDLSFQMLFDIGKPQSSHGGGL